MNKIETGESAHVFQVGEKVRVTELWYGAAVYGKKGEIVNLNQRPQEHMFTGVIDWIGPDSAGGPIAIRGETLGSNKRRFSEYPYNNRENVNIEVIK